MPEKMVKSKISNLDVRVTVRHRRQKEKKNFDPDYLRGGFVHPTPQLMPRWGTSLFESPEACTTLSNHQLKFKKTLRTKWGGPSINKQIKLTQTC